METISGADGELIRQLMRVVDDNPLGEELWWFEIGGLLVHAVGGCDDIAPNSGKVYVNGEIGWEHRGEREIVSREIWMSRIQAQLHALVALGLAEDFLVSSLRDHIATELDRAVANPTGAAVKSNFDEWLAQQATSSDNLELSLIARSLMGPATDAAPDANPSGEGAQSALRRRWSTASEPISADTVARWRQARLNRPVSA